MVVTEEEFTNWIAERTRRVTDRLKESVVTPFAFVEEASRYLLDAGGKMFRPSLVFAAGGLGHPAEGRTPGSRLGTQEAENPSTPGHPAEGRTPGSRLGTQAAENPSTPGHPAEGRTPGSRLGTQAAENYFDEESLLTAAVVVELTHVASLYHDDVMDEAEMRRGGPAAHIKWSNSIAILVGDYMLAQASLLGATLGEDFITHQAKTLGRLVQGQIAELRGPEDGADPVAHHLGVISDKTAALIAASVRYGGQFAGLPQSQVEALTQYGECLGMAFQLADDLLDMLSEESGKPMGTDLREGVPTLATLLVQDHPRIQDTRLLELLAAPVTEEDLPEALSLLRSHPAIDEARTHIQSWADKALTHLDGFEEGPALTSLRTLCTQATVRLK